MSRYFQNAAAALASVLIVTVGLATIFAAPPASAAIMVAAPLLA